MQQAGGFHTVTIANYERIFQQTKLTDIDGCDMQTYADRIIPVIESLHRLGRFPLHATKTMLENTAGMHNEPFQMIRTTALPAALSVAPVESDLHADKDLCLLTINQLVALYTDEVKGWLLGAFA